VSAVVTHAAHACVEPLARRWWRCRFYGASTDLTGTQAYGYTIEVSLPNDACQLGRSPRIDILAAGPFLAASGQLRPDEGGQHDIPPSEIVPTGQEIYAAVKVFARTVLDNPLALRRAKHP